MAQQTFSEAYGSQPANPSKGSWLARVSHRASHIPNRPAAAPASGIAALRSRDSLPLRTPGTAGLVTHEQLPVAQKTSSYPASPSSPDSPAETEFGATPIDSTFGDRVEPATLSDRPAAQRQPGARRGTVTQTDILHQGSEETMDKYAVQAGDNSYDSDGEADDEFERSIFTSPTLNEEFDDDDVSTHPSETEDEHDSLEDDDTPTTQGWADRDGRSPLGKISDWTEDEVADYISALSPALKQYAPRFVEEGVSGDIIVAISHDELRELGVASAGHRLTILKAVYEQKRRSGVRIEEGHYVPLSAEGEKADMTATQEDITRIIESIRLRDQRIIAAEAELRAMRHDLDRISEENRKLREETLPIMRIMKDQRTPLPDPSAGPLPSPREAEAPRLQQQLPAQPQEKGSTLSRKFSISKRIPALVKDGSKQSSPTIPPYSPNIRDDGSSHIEASAAALAASSHLTASMTSQASPVHPQPSPTSPAYNIAQLSSGAGYAPPGSAAQRSFPRDGSQSARPDQRTFSHTDDQGTRLPANDSGSQADFIIKVPQSARPHVGSRRQPTPSPREEESSSSNR